MKNLKVHLINLIEDGHHGLLSDLLSRSAAAPNDSVSLVITYAPLNNKERVFEPE
jgi:hypothetical protein